jgi:hypothetical protein
MIKKIIFCIIGIELLMSIGLLARETITPLGRPRMVGFDNDKGRVWRYYCLEKGESMGLAVEGPVTVDLRTRAGLPRENIQAEYQIQVWESEYLIAAEKFKSKAVEAVMENSALFPAAFRRVSFDVPAGVHNYRLWLVSDNIDTVFVRLYKSDLSEEEPEEVDLQLMSYSRQVHLYSKKNQTPYYLVDESGGAKLKVTGPADIIIRARANFTASMEGRIGYTIGMMENDREVQALSATTSKSLTMAYQDYTGVVPSRPTEFIISVPAGVHVYDFVLKESAAPTVSIRFSIPSQD